MGKIIFVLSDNQKLTWYTNEPFLKYKDFCAYILSDYLKENKATITSIIKVSDQGSTTTFDLTFDN